MAMVDTRPPRGSGEGLPVNGLIGSGLLLAAGGILAGDVLKRRREALDRD